MKRIGLLTTAAAAAVCGAGPAFAHTGGAGAGGGLASGLAHPVGGPDHVLAMVAVGLLAATLHAGGDEAGRGRALWLVPGAFLAAMAAGGLAGMAGLALPYVETGITVSLVALGALIAARVHLPVVAAMAVAGLFAVFHGHAHGAEAPAAAAPLAYAAGFMLATALLHAAGLGLGLLCLAPRRGGRLVALPRLGGGVIAAAGVLLLAA